MFQRRLSFILKLNMHFEERQGCNGFLSLFLFHAQKHTYTHCIDLINLHVGLKEKMGGVNNYWEIFKTD
jgi:hypothetical protein